MDELLREVPHLHGYGPDGTTQSWVLAPESLRTLDRSLRPGMRTVETGAGLSTIVFAMAGARHTCVCPAEDEIERIRGFCVPRGISTEHVEFVIDRSESALPRLELVDLDLVLIDGSHSFPTVFMDWYYTASSLKVDGKLVVDDIQLWTGRVLRDFLRAEPDWELVEEVTMITSVFVKRRAVVGVRDWVDQPFVVRRSLTTPVRRALRMALDGDLRPLGRKGLRRLRPPNVSA